MQRIEIINEENLKPCPGVFIDIDGVVWHGGKPFEWSKAAIHTLWTNDVPFMFVTNGTYSSKVLLDQLKGMFELPFTNEHVVVAPSPCLGLTEYHDKHVLVCCQNDSIDLITELGFTQYTTIDQLVEIFPELDYVDHEKRIQLLKTPMTAERQRKIDEFRPIELILLLGEPVNWECSLQVLIDVLMTNGDPRSKFKYVPSPHLPIIACNKDLTFKGAAPLPRFGHGAFLECFETLYMKITRNELEYEHVMGKPYIVTYEFAASQIQRLAGPGRRVTKYYIIGDNPDVDVKGANLYKEHLLRLEALANPVAHAPNALSGIRSNRSSRRSSLYGIVEFDLRQTARVESILVCTGVYNPQNDLLFQIHNLFEKRAQINDLNNNISAVGFESQDNKDTNSSSEPSTLSRNESSTSLGADADNMLDELDRKELKQALCRKNSFISYFDNKYNVPDTTVDNLLDAVQHIIRRKLLEDI